MIEFIFRHSLLIGLATVVLLIGEATPNERLVLFGLPLNTAVVVGLGLASLVISTSVQAVRFAGLAFLFLIVGVVYGLALSDNPDYGLYKGLNLIVVSLTVIIVYHHFYVQGEQDRLWTLVVLIMLAYLLAAFLYKLQNGLWDRQTLFLMNGPIVFGRLMSMAAVLSLLFLRGPLRVALFLLFTIAVFWSSSKGPLLALAVVLGLYMIAQRRLIVLSLVGILASLVLLLVPELLFDLLRLLDGSGRIAVILESALIGSQLSDAQAVTFGARLSAFNETITLIVQHPMGVGLGDWQAHTRELVDYPHNIFLEAFAEMGLVFGSLFLIPYLWPLVMAQNPLRWVTLLFVINQQVSGDILDSRYWLIFGILSCLPVRAPAREQTTPGLPDLQLAFGSIQGTHIVYGKRKSS